MFMVSEHESGYICEFSVYTGRASSELLLQNSMLDPYCTVTMKTVMGLLQSTNMLDKHRTVFFDNYFSSPELCEELFYRDSYACRMVHGTKKLKLKKGKTVYRRKRNMLCLQMVRQMHSNFVVDKTHCC